MTKLEEFAFWFSGYLEAAPLVLHREEIKMIREKLKAAMRKEVVRGPNQFDQEELNR